MAKCLRQWRSFVVVFKRSVKSLITPMTKFEEKYVRVEFLGCCVISQQQNHSTAAIDSICTQLSCTERTSIGS